MSCLLFFFLFFLTLNNQILDMLGNSTRNVGRSTKGLRQVAESVQTAGVEEVLAEWFHSPEPTFYTNKWHNNG